MKSFPVLTGFIISHCKDPVINQSGLNGMPVNGFVDVASFKKNIHKDFLL